jgi:hypothetical protein
MSNYDYYNREERAICAHLFRLLHEELKGKRESPLGRFIGELAKKKLELRNGTTSLIDLNYENIGIYCEASMIRDAYQYNKPNIKTFMDSLTQLIMRQENVSICRTYSQLPEPLSNQKLTHPKQIRQKAKAEGVVLSGDESKVFGAMQGMFNAKPDLAITIDNLLLVCEAKHTEPFDEIQLKRTWNIAEVWATLLYKDFGFSQPPVYSVFTLGAGKFDPHINWKDISEIARQTYGENDRSRIAIVAGMELLKRIGLE